MGTSADRRRIVVIALGVCFLVLFFTLATLNAFNLNFLNPASPLQTLVFIALSTVAFLLFVGVLVLLVRNVLKLYGDQKSRVLGTRLRTRMLWGAVLVSIVPLVFMFLFSYLLMNRALDRWFSQPVKRMHDDSLGMAEQLTQYIYANARSEADSIAAGLNGSAKTTPTAAQVELERHEVTLQGGFAIVYRDGAPVASVQVPHTKGVASFRPPQGVDNSTDENPTAAPEPESVSLPGPAQNAILLAAKRNDGAMYTLGDTDYILATAALKRSGLVVVGLPEPYEIGKTALSIRNADTQYQVLLRERRQVRNLYMFLLLLMTSLALFVCCWLALNLSKQVTKPIETLADAMEVIASGDYGHRVVASATQELGELGDSFNTMAADLESARTSAEQSTAQLSELNAVLLARRTELETIIETIPNGVVTLSTQRQIVIANRAFSEMLDPGGQKHFVGADLADVLPVEISEALDRLMRRAHRMGSAATELQLPSLSPPLHLSATIAVLEHGAAPPREHVGYVLVLENITDLLHAQKQSAWKEVARRVAHEIKNPLTPISLNAELIQRHNTRMAPLLAERGIESRSIEVIQRSCEVIASSVETMRALVDQFSSLAEFPSARPQPAVLNTIVERTLSLFAGRLGNMRVTQSLAPNLPLVLADAEGLKRALSNLIDNAAEAMQGSLLRDLHVTTHLLDSGMIALEVADTGPGLTDDMRERLFLPYFSTKQRGTGLGLSIAAKIIQEHGGTIRAESNKPVGARFIIELRPAHGLESESLAASPAALVEGAVA